MHLHSNSQMHRNRSARPIHDRRRLGASSHLADGRHSVPKLAARAGNSRAVAVVPGRCATSEEQHGSETSQAVIERRWHRR